ncbi:hypothetical protein LXA43DRAFT_1097771 [Ganoderma leucocontextum]|nr:hypothetical protein LXA43DRAFT_1097771 [Ganoderma leucocontextum]
MTLWQLIAMWTARDPTLSSVLLRTLCDGVAVKVVDPVSRLRRPDSSTRTNPSSGKSEHGKDPAVVEDAVTVLIELRQCRLRRPDEGEEEWVKAKVLQLAG